MEDSTFYIAIYGALLATFVFAWDIFKYLKDQPNLRIETNFRILGGGISETKIGVDLINQGKRPVTIVASGFVLDTEPTEPNIATILDPNLPVELREGQKHTSFANSDTVNTSKILYAWARDATGKEYYSNKRPF